MNTIIKLNSTEQTQIENWDIMYKNNPNYKQILNMLGAPSLCNYFSRISSSRNVLNDNQKFGYVLKDDQNRIMTFILFVLHPTTGTDYTMFIQSIVTHPHYRKLGYATELLYTILKNPEQYMFVKPVEIKAVVNAKNVASIQLFNQFAKFNRTLYDDSFMLSKDYASIENVLNTNLSV